MNIHIKNIDKWFNSNKVLSDVSFSLEDREIHALMGENGAGKSTLMKILSGVYTKDKGSIFIDGKEMYFKNPKEAQKYGISFIYQELNILHDLTVEENLFIGKEIKNRFGICNSKAMQEKSREILSTLNVNIDPKTRMCDLSVGQHQMIEICKSLLNDVKVIIMDEPTSSLSSAETRVLLDIVKDLKAQGITIIYISHKLEELYEIGDRFTVIRDGQVINTWNIGDISDDELIHAMVGREVSMIYTPPSYTDGKVVLQAKNLSKKGHFKNISFDLKEGEILGFAGIVGAGRTELMEALFGVTQFDEGELTIDGVSVKFKTPYEACGHKLAFVPEDRKGQGLVLYTSVHDNINMLVSEYKNNRGFLDFKWMKFNTENWMKQLEVRPNLPDMLTALQSGGNQQKVVLAKCLSTSPRVLIIDEPTNGIDVGAKSNIHKLIRSLSDEGLAVIVVSSDLLEVLSVCDRVVVMKKGRMSAVLDNKNLTQNDVMKYAI